MGNALAEVEQGDTFTFSNFESLSTTQLHRGTLSDFEQLRSDLQRRYSAVTVEIDPFYDEGTS